MKRILFIFSALLLLTVNIGLSQSINASGHDDHNVYPLIIALIMLTLAIITRLIVVNQSRKPGNTI
ncbi:MAG TPA: hypothetical protein PLR06_12340 [Cyclobacteriaceae bacterium]|nr:hypothetical protein [Cyclobacteriaceae bacterium]